MLKDYPKMATKFDSYKTNSPQDALRTIAMTRRSSILKIDGQAMMVGRLGQGDTKLATKT
jgi:prophage tail gpP-like protein